MASLSLESQWLAQLASMRAALAELNLSQINDNEHYETKQYGQDILLDDEDLSSASGYGDLWDYISDEEDHSSDYNGGASGVVYGMEWLGEMCQDFAGRKAGLDARELEEQIVALLTHHSDGMLDFTYTRYIVFKVSNTHLEVRHLLVLRGYLEVMPKIVHPRIAFLLLTRACPRANRCSADNELQSTLTDILGFDDLDLVIEIITHRTEITSGRHASAGSINGVLGQLLSREEREAALRRQNYEHRNAILAPRMNREGAAQYPHVYKNHSAGNMLSYNGRKYVLPAGHKREEHEVPKSSPQTIGVNYS
jgi:antiviral helicase SLH1